MQKFLVKVNGIDYEVEVEEIRDGNAGQEKPSFPVVTTELKSEKTEKASPAPTPPVQKSGDKTIASPMPGTILSIAVKTGESVKKGQVLAILEAMKMENEIMAPEDGTVAAVHVSAGATVDTGSALVTLA